MKIRVRMAAALAACLIVCGSVALLAEWAALARAHYPTWPEYRDALIEELGTDQETVIRRIGEQPELLFDGPPHDALANGREAINQASQRVQRHAVADAADESRRWTAAALLLITAGSVIAAWFLAGRLLRPIRLITAKARAASGDDLAARVALRGPNDEIKELADTFDAMLERIERSFEAQRRFAGQVAHELRTPLTVTRSEVELLLDDVADADLRGRLVHVADATRRAERLVAQLLVLARTESGDLDVERFALDELVGNVLGRAVEAPEWRQVRLDVDLEPVLVAADRALVDSLVRNLVHNAARHNRADGWVKVSVGAEPDGASAVLVVANSIADADGPGASGPCPGQPHVGLTIVRAVLDAHHGSIDWQCTTSSVRAVVRLPALVPSPVAQSDRLLLGG